MTFEQRLHAMITAPAPDHAKYSRDPPAALIAVHAPYLLQRFATLAGALQGCALPCGQGVILACRNGPLGYRTVEYSSRDLYIVLDATEREACLRWAANGETGSYLLTPDTTAYNLDDAILHAVSTFVRACTPLRT